MLSFKSGVPPTPTGKAFAIAGSVLISLSLLAELIALGGTWWKDTHTLGEGSEILVGELAVTLWDVHVTSPHGKFEDYSIGWEDYCGEKFVNDESWCHKIRTTRTMTILAIIFGLLALTSFTLVAFVNRAWGGRAVMCTLVSMSCAICAFSVSIFFPTYSRPSVSEPGVGFIMTCFATLISFVTAILNFYGMRYNFTSGLKESATAQKDSNGKAQNGNSDEDLSASATLGKACVIAAGGLIFLGIVMELVGLVGPWWLDTHVHVKSDLTVVADVVATLWRVELSSPKGVFDHLSISWEEYCSEQYVNEQSWCHKIRSVRATMFLALLLSIASLILLSISAVIKRKGFGTGAVACAFVSLMCAVCSFTTSLFYPTESSPSVDTPGFAFLVVCLASLLDAIAVLLACYGLWYNSNSGFKNEESNSRDWKIKEASGTMTPPPTAYGSESELVEDGNGEPVGQYLSEKV